MSIQFVFLLFTTLQAKKSEYFNRIKLDGYMNLSLFVVTSIMIFIHNSSRGIYLAFHHERDNKILLHKANVFLTFNMKGKCLNEYFKLPSYLVNYWITYFYCEETFLLENCLLPICWKFLACAAYKVYLNRK